MISRRDTSHVFGGKAKEGFRQSFTWGENGQLLSETYPDCITPTLCGASAARTVGYGTTNGRLTSVTGLAPAMGFSSAITYHANGMPATVVRANGTTDVFDRDPHWMIRPAAISTQKTNDGTVLWTTNGYLYDGSGNVRKMGNASFIYDSLSRLTSGTVLPGRLGDGIAQNQSQTYDIYGNITTVTTNTVVRNTPTSTANNRLISAGTTYDSAGNMTAWSGNSYEHDVFNQMTRMLSGAEDRRYIYDANDERLWSYRVGGGGSLWTLRGLNSQVLREYRSHLSWSNSVDSIFRGNALLAIAPSAAAGGGVNHLHPDHLGTPRLITNSVGAVAGFHAYYPFGEELTATFNTGYADRQRFTGHERDLANASGQADDLDYMHARHCSPIVGRFLSVDEHEGEPQLPQSWNRYSYALGNPQKYLDPDGNSAAAVVVVPIGLVVLTVAVIDHTEQMRNNPEYRAAVLGAAQSLISLMGKSGGGGRDSEYIGRSDADLLAASALATGAERARINREFKNRKLRNMGKARGGAREPKKPKKPKDGQNKYEISQMVRSQIDPDILMLLKHVDLSEERQAICGVGIASCPI